MIYLDYNATTPIDSRLSDAARLYVGSVFGNPSSRDHAYGWNASEAVASSRDCVAAVINAIPQEITFTGSATEALNTAIKGFVTSQNARPKKIVTCATEHEAVLAPCRQVKRLAGIETEILPVDRLGHIDLDQLRSALAADREILVVLMAANNEIGTVHPIREIGAIVHRTKAVFLCDLTQAVGKIGVDVRGDGVHMAAFSAHKICGPKGIGALFIRHGEPRIHLEPLIAGGGQEGGLRGGTLNVSGIIGFGDACKIAQEEWKDEARRVGLLRDKLEQSLRCAVPDIWINGDLENRIPNTSNIGFRGIDARTLIREMHGVAVSTRSACSSGMTGPSHVLKAIGLPDEEAYSSIRFSLGRFTTEEEIANAVGKVVASARKLRASRHAMPLSQGS